MATKAELRVQIGELAEKHGVVIDPALGPLDQLNLTRLTEVLADLEKQVGVAGAGTPPAPPAASGPAVQRVLPAGYTRPTVEEFVKAGYLAENYESFFANYEANLASNPAPAPVPAPEPVLADPSVADAGVSAPPPALAKDASPDSPLSKPEVKTVRGFHEDLGGTPKPGSVRYRFPYTVREGHSVAATRRGTVPAFARITALDLPGGQAELDDLVAAGVVVRK